jgi:Holliday junction resolvase RusA-like endonuclease
MSLPSYADPPFACPPDDPVVGGLVIDLPYPPSVNKIWKSASALASNKVYLSPSYVKWKSLADALLMSQRGWMSRRLTGPFSIDIDLCPPARYPRGDLDNRIKATLDFLQRASVIANDKDCQRLVAQWVGQGRAPEGCRVTLRPMKLTVNGILQGVAERLEAR